MLAPEPYLSACLEVLYHATLNARVILLQQWENCDEGLLRSFLETFDTKWKRTNAGLLLVYEEALAKHRTTPLRPDST